MRSFFRRLSPVPRDRAEVVLMGTIALCAIAMLLTACQYLPATREYAEQVAADNANSAAEGNTFSSIIHTAAMLFLALSGGVLTTKRALTKYDAKPFAGADGREVTEARVVAAVEKIEGGAKPPG